MARLLTYTPKNTWIHRLSGVTKMLFFILWSIAGMLTYDTRILAVMLAVSLLIFKVSKTEWKQVGTVFKFILFFLFLNLLVLAIVLAFNFMASGVTVDLPAYLVYFFLISIPTLIFIIGLSIFLMLLLKNQALTFILLLGYIGLTLFYIQDKFCLLYTSPSPRDCS